MDKHLPGITWLRGTSQRIHALRSSKAWETATLCGQNIDNMVSIEPYLFREELLCQRCQKGLRVWGYITQPKPVIHLSNEEIVAPLGIRRTDITKALKGQQIKPTPQAVKSVTRYLQRTAAAWAKATLQDEKDWRSWFAEEMEHA